jgi:predicted nucleic acid-binding protein
LPLFADRMDKDWSLMGCISFVMMHQHELPAALTTERHFERAGSVAPLK